MTGARDLSREAVRARVKGTKARAKALAREKRRDLLASAADAVDWRKAKRVLLEDSAPGVTQDRYAHIWDDEGRLSQPMRLHDTLRALDGRRVITRAQYQAGRKFADLAEQGETLRAASLLRLGAGGDDGHHDRALDAAAALQHLNRAMAAIGGQGSAPARVCWLVLAEGHTLANAAERLKKLPDGKEGERAAKWVLIAALDILAVHWRFDNGQE